MLACILLYDTLAAAERFDRLLDSSGGNDNFFQKIGG
jgi:hypothetical protein